MSKYNNIFDRLKNGDFIPFNDPEYFKIHEAVNETKKLSVALNNATTSEEIRDLLSPQVQLWVAFETLVLFNFQLLRLNASYL